MTTRFYSNPDGTGLAGGLPCQAPSEGDPTIRVAAFRASHPAKPRRASRDLFSASLKVEGGDA
jgi:hypothetical protein